MSRNFTDDAHAYVSGSLVGALLKAGLFIRPFVDDDGNYTPVSVYTDEGGREWTITVAPVEDS